MRYLLIICCLLSFAASAQTKADHERVMAKFMKFYNAGQDDSIYYLFSKSDRKYITPESNVESMKMCRDKFGNILSYKYLGIDNEDPDHVTVFKTDWSKAGEKTTSFTLDKQNGFLTFRLITSSDGIDKLLKKTK